MKLKGATFILAGSIASAAHAGVGVVVDGQISLGEGYTDAVYQNNATSFGNNFNELDGMFVRLDGVKCNIGLTGNLSSGNAIVVFVQFNSAGSNTLNSIGAGVPGYLQGQNGLKFDAGFAPSLAFAINRFGNDLYYDIVDLTTPAGFYLGTHAVNGGGPIGTGPAWFDDTNTAGVGGGTGPDDGSSATTGLEFEFDFVAQHSSIKTMAMLTNNGDGFASNQVLGGLGGGWDHLAFGPGGSSGNSKIDFSTIDGDQCMLVNNVVPEPATMIAVAAGLAGIASRRRRK